MNFFEHQEAARKRTGMLVVLYGLAVALVVLAVYAAVMGIFQLGRSFEGPREERATGIAQVDRVIRTAEPLWDPGIFGIVSGITLLLIGGGTLHKMIALSRGGAAVADLLGGRLLHQETTDPDERRLLNVVEEMAIAAGTPVPPVYLMDRENGINAFAAGFAPGDAVIGVTQGTIRQLNRDELQGVIAHEFSHILNGDMKLNLRLMGVLFGILIIALTGWFILRVSLRGGFRMGAKKKGGNPLPLLGLALFVIGYVGVFFASLIKAAVSRQREYLADAAAVQFTRNPDGIGGALRKIGALGQGSRLDNPNAEEASHMFFGNALSGIMNLFGLLSTHPPLEKRIKRIDPSFDGNFRAVRLAPEPSPTTEPRRGSAAGPGLPGGLGGATVALLASEAMDQVGQFGPQHIGLAVEILARIPESLKHTARDPFGASALVYALLLDEREEIRERQLDRLMASAPAASYLAAKKAFQQMQGVSSDCRLPLAELALPALRQMSTGQFQQFASNLRELIMADDRVSLFEFALQRMVLRNLARHFGLLGGRKAKSKRPEDLAGAVQTVLSALAHVGQRHDAAAAARAFGEGVKALGWDQRARLELSSEEAVSLKAVAESLDEMAEARPRIKQQVLAACASCIGADGKVQTEELELLRAVSESLDCPMPPLMRRGASANT